MKLLSGHFMLTRKIGQAFNIQKFELNRNHSLHKINWKQIWKRHLYSFANKVNISRRFILLLLLECNRIVFSLKNSEENQSGLNSSGLEIFLADFLCLPAITPRGRIDHNQSDQTPLPLHLIMPPRIRSRAPVPKIGGYPPPALN